MKAILKACPIAPCSSNTTSAQTQGNSREVRGNGNIVKKTYSACVFEAVEIGNFPADVKIVLSGKLLQDKPFLEVQAGDEERKVILSGK